jgi:hypothetical protein
LTFASSTLKRKKSKTSRPYDLVVVGSGIQFYRWTSEPENFLKKFQKELATKKLAFFVCCGSATDKEKPELAEKARRKYLEEKAAKPELLCSSAVLTFQDSVELFLQSVAENLGIGKGLTNIKFLDYWARINPVSQRKGKSELTHLVAMERLNRARVDFKHLGRA